MLTPLNGRFWLADLFLAAGLLVAAAAPAARAEPSDPTPAVVQELVQQEDVKHLRGKTVIFANLLVDNAGGPELVEMAGDLRASLQTALIRSKYFRMVERSQLDRILKEQKLELSDLADPAQVRKLGGLLTADLMLFGELTKSGTRTRLNLRLIDIRTGIAVTAINQVVGNAARRPEVATGNGQEEMASIPKRGRVLLVALTSEVETFLKDAGVECERRSVLPDRLDGYSAVLMVDWSAVAPGAASTLTQYVESGGGLMTWAAVPIRLNEREPSLLGTLSGEYKLKSPWMGITAMRLGRENSTFTIDVPDRLLGTAVKSPRPTKFESRPDSRIIGIFGHQAGGNIWA